MDKVVIMNKLALNASHLKRNSTTRFKTSIENNFISSGPISLDLSNQLISKEAYNYLLALPDTIKLKEKINELFSGKNVNKSEKIPALHTALRTKSTNIIVNGHNIIKDILIAKEQIKDISEKIRNKQWLGQTGKPITDIVNIGIGGSALGPTLGVNALDDYINTDINFHFISDASPKLFAKTVKNLNKETTLFIVASKSFTTQETLYNAKKAKDWLSSSQYFKRHFIAITANIKNAQDFQISNIIPIWPWIGGRYSFCSAINLITAIAIGYDNFTKILEGAAEIDNHFQNAPWHNNLPVMLALTGIWNNNFLDINNLLLLTYGHELDTFTNYIQQLDMESNGKNIDTQMQAVRQSTGPIVWGGSGNQAQHSYYQLLCQGTKISAIELIRFKALENEMINNISDNHINILTQGVRAHQKNEEIKPRIPINIIEIDKCTPYSLGLLISLYEHKIFTQASIWNINPFDQPGVQSAKAACSKIHREDFSAI